MGVHDSGYKLIFAFPAMIKDLLQGFVRESRKIAGDLIEEAAAELGGF